MIGRVSSLVVAVTVFAAIPAMAHPGSGIVVDRLGQVWFLDTGDGLWKIDTTGTLIHVGGNRFHWMTLDQNGAFSSTPLPRDVARVGTNPTLLIASDYPIAMGRDGNLYYPSAGAEGRVRIVRQLPSGATSVLATLPAITTDGQSLRWVNGLAGGADGAAYFTENNAIRRISATGQITTVATNLHVAGCVSIPGNTPNDGLLLRGLSVDAAGVIYVAASGCGSVLRISPDGRVTKLVQLESPWSPTAVALFGTDVYVLEYLHTEVEDRRAWVPRVRRITPDGNSVVIAKVERTQHR